MQKKQVKHWKRKLKRNIRKYNLNEKQMVEIMKLAL